MVRWMLSMGLVGCVAPEQLAQERIDGTTLLEGPGSDFAERVRPSVHSRARLLPDGPQLPRASGTRGSLVGHALIVVDPGPRPRVRLHTGSVEVLLYLERGDLQAHATGDGVGTGWDGRGEVHLPPGTPVEVLQIEGDRVSLAIEHEKIAIDAWFPRASVDEIFFADPAPPPTGPLDSGHPIASEILFDAPRGEPLAWLRDPDDLWFGHVIGAPIRGFLPITIDDVSGVRLSGWIPEADLDRRALSYGAHGEGGTWRSACGPILLSPIGCASLPPGTWLHAGPDGPVVARVTDAILVPPASASGWVSVVEQSPLGEIALWAHPGDVVFGDDPACW